MSRVRVVALLLVGGGCGRFGYDDSNPPFDPPTPLTEITSTQGDDDPTLTADRLELVFASTRPGGLGGEDLWVTRRNTTDDPWGPPEHIPELSSTGFDSTPELAPDGLTIFFSSQRTGSMGIDIYFSCRSSRGAAWDPPMRVDGLSSGDNDASPAPFDDLRRVVLSSNRPDTAGGQDLFLAERASASDLWPAPTRVVELATTVDDAEPHLVRSTVLVFASSRDGDSNLYLAERPSLMEPFGTAEPLVELNSAADDNDPWVSDDLQYVYFSSDRDGTRRIYEARRP